MASHRFKLGDLVELTGKSRLNAPREPFEIVRLLPRTGDEPEYRIKGPNEGHQRSVKESELRRLKGWGFSPAPLAAGKAEEGEEAVRTGLLKFAIWAQYQGSHRHSMKWKRRWHAFADWIVRIERKTRGRKAVTKQPSDGGAAERLIADRAVLKALGAKSSGAEAELLAIVRGRPGEFVLSIHCQEGRWKVRHVVMAPEYSTREGFGATFAQAWKNQAPAGQAR